MYQRKKTANLGFIGWVGLILLFTVLFIGAIALSMLLIQIAWNGIAGIFNSNFTISYLQAIYPVIVISILSSFARLASLK